MRPQLELDPAGRPAGGDVAIALEATPWRIGPSRRLTVIAKCTVQLVAEGAGLPIAAEPLAASTVEVAPVLPHPQITLVGHAYAPAGTRCGMQPARVALVRGSTTVFDKSILVYGDRTSPTDFAQPFDVMPLIHERAPGSGWNPVGRLLARGDSPPNLVPCAPGQPIACFAPIPAGFPARAAIFDPSAIQRDGDLLAFGLFDFRWFQDAPFDQWLPPIEGGETLILEGLSPYVPRLATGLPAMLMQASWWHGGGATGRIRLRLGRIDVDVDRGVASLIWRGHFALPMGAMASDVLVRVTTRETTGATTLAEIAGGEEDDGPPTRAGLPRRVLASLVDVSRATLADVSRATLADMSRATLADIDVGPSSGSPGAGPGSGTLPFRGPPPVATVAMAAVPRVSAPAQAAPAPAAPAAAPIAPPTREQLLSRLLDGSLTGDALRGADLSGASLVNAELQGRDLSGARLAGANLDGARLQGARLDQADLTGATLRGADLENASLLGARLGGADLGKASLREASLASVDAEGARFGGADLTRSRAARARFVRARFDGARLDQADWPEAVLEGASFVEAFLCRATITKGSFVRANLTRADLREGSMQGAVFTGALCDAAAFDRTDLSGADLAGAHLNEGALRRARTTGAKLR